MCIYKTWSTNFAVIVVCALHTNNKITIELLIDSFEMLNLHGRTIKLANKWRKNTVYNWIYQNSAWPLDPLFWFIKQNRAHYKNYADLPATTKTKFRLNWTSHCTKQGDKIKPYFSVQKSKWNKRNIRNRKQFICVTVIYCFVSTEMH